MTNTYEAKFVVCPECEGEGHFGPGFVSTASEEDERWGADFDARDQFWGAVREGHFDVPCGTCKGARVVPARNEYGETAEETWRAECEYRAEVAAERRMGC